jgi:hypothetical protein
MLQYHRKAEIDLDAKEEQHATNRRERFYHRLSSALEAQDLATNACGASARFVDLFYRKEHPCTT